MSRRHKSGNASKQQMQMLPIVWRMKSRVYCLGYDYILGKSNRNECLYCTTIMPATVSSPYPYPYTYSYPSRCTYPASGGSFVWSLQFCIRRRLVFGVWTAIDSWPHNEPFAAQPLCGFLELSHHHGGFSKNWETAFDRVKGDAIELDLHFKHHRLELSNRTT